MPHINIKYFPLVLSTEEKEQITAEITSIITKRFKCSEHVISIALEPIPGEVWMEQVYAKEIEGRAHLLCKTPHYELATGENND